MTALSQVQPAADAGRERGGARTQILFRELNEQISGLGELFGLGADLELVCECTNGSCLQRFAVSGDAYDAIRRFPTRFVVRRGHADQQVERVVDQTLTYLVVEKVGTDAEEAVRLDPRRSGARRNGRS